MSVSNTGVDDTTAFGMLIGDPVSIAGGINSVLSSVGSVAQQAGVTASQINAAQAQANAPVVTSAQYVDPVTGQRSVFGSLGAASPTEKLMLMLAVIAIVLGLSHTK
jgi:hypothetical protein